jgi:hypothetical protein
LLNKNKSIYIVLIAVLVLGFYQTLRIDAPNYDLKLTRHISIIENNIEYPYKYRLLNPFIAEVWFSALSLALPEKPAFLAAYFFQNVLVFGFILFMAFRFFRLWFDDTGGVISLLLLTLIVPLTLTGYDVLGDMTTAGIMALGFTFINSTGKEKYLYPLLFIAAFNELQCILLIAFYFFAKKSNLLDKKIWLNSILMVIIFVAAYALIYFIRGGTAGGGEVSWYFTKDAAFNIAHKDWIPLWFILIAPLLYPALKNIKLKPEFLRRSAVIVLPLFYFGAFFFIARLREIDKALTIFLILIPLTVFYLFPAHVIAKEKEVNG